MAKSMRAANDVKHLLGARNPLLWIQTGEEARVEAYLVEAAAAAGYTVRMWDVAQGITDLAGTFNGAEYKDPGAALDWVTEQAKTGRTGRGVLIMRDLAPWVAAPVGLQTQRQLRNLARMLPGTARDRAQAIVVISAGGDIPRELANHATAIDWPLPDRDEIAGILEDAVEVLPEKWKEKALTDDTRETAIDAAVGLSGEEAQACFAKSLVQAKRIDPITVAREKKRIITRERVLEWSDPLPGGLEAVGGLDLLKGWLNSRKLAYTPRARAYRLPAPRGALLVGVPGCGKTHIAKAVATAWGVPLLKMDMGALKSKFVGESEANLRKVFRVVAAIGRCVLLVDEIEKALAGATQGAADGGVSGDALGSLLSWMQDREGEAFVLATANDVEALPPELMRKGRFDEIWFVDVPTRKGRVEVIKSALAAHGREDLAIDLNAVAEVCEEFTGAELAALVPEALYVAFADREREPTTRDLLNAAADVVPLVKTAGAKIDRLREWANERARMATSPDTATTTTTRKRGRTVDL